MSFIQRSRTAAVVLCGSVAGVLLIFGTGSLLAEGQGRRIEQSDLEYVGAFRVPFLRGKEVAGFSFGGYALTYNPARNSLLASGHVRSSYVAEISIPESAPVDQIDELKTASILQPFHGDPAESSELRTAQ